MSRRAARVDANQPAIVAALRREGVRVFDTHRLGSGFPDLVALHRDGRSVVLIEVKDGSKPPSARRLTDDEAAFAALFPVSVVMTEREALAAVGVES